MECLFLSPGKNREGKAKMTKKRNMFVLSGIIVLAVLGFGVLKDQLIKSAVSIIGSQVVGAPVHIDTLSVGVLKQSIRISGLKMYNPKGFPAGILIDIATIHVDYDLGALLKKKIHLTSAEFDLREMGLVKNKEGKLNVDSLKFVQESKASKEAHQQEKQAPQMPLAIDMLKLGIGKLVSKDYTAGSEPSVQVYNINIHKSYKNIKSAQALAALVLSEPMKSAGIKGAAVYGVSMLAGVAILPVAVAATFTGKDSAEQDFDAAFDTVYALGLSVLKKMGNVTLENATEGVIKANINAAMIAVKLQKVSEKKTKVVVSARKYLLPKPQVAAGVVYEMLAQFK
jgi:hypothetical protein